MNTSLSRKRNYAAWLLAVLVALDFLIWRAIFISHAAARPELYFFDVGQGDSQLVSLPGGVRLLIDGGAGTKVLDGLARALPPASRYIDLVLLTHPQLDHFGGLIEVVKKYDVGTFITSGAKSSTRSYQELLGLISDKRLPFVVLGAGDRIRYGDYILEILGPPAANLTSKDLNDASLVTLLRAAGFKALYTGDIGFDYENQLAAIYDLGADILKVPHHGSKYSSGQNFLNEVKPKVAVIGVGKNSYGHPTREALARLASTGSLIYRTDRDGTLKVIFDGHKLKIYNKQ